VNKHLGKIACALLAAAPLTLLGLSTGPPARRTGAPVDASPTCTACHLPGADMTGGFVRIEAAPYRPGQRQTIRVIVGHPDAQRWGFQLTARFASDETRKAGTFAFGGPIRVRCNDGRFVTDQEGCGSDLEFASHGGSPESTLGGTSGVKTFEVEWTAPEGMDLGDIVFYAAGNAANNSGNNQGDRVYTTSLRVEAENTCNYLVRPRVQGIGNAATSQAGVSMNSLVAIYGANFVPSGVRRTAAAGDIRSNRFPAELGCVAVEIAGQRVPVTHIQQDQLNVQAPTIAQTGSVPVRVIINPGRPSEVSVDGGPLNLQTYAPAFFTFNSTSIAARHPDFSVLADPSVVAGGRAARPGDVVLLYATGLGDTMPSTWQAGELVSGQHRTRVPVRITIGGTTVPDADVEYTGLVPGSISGLYQLNVRLPATLAPGNVPVSMTIGGVSSPPGTTIPVQAR
jgi:uncharacterized protein (TIGR03437 family)